VNNSRISSNLLRELVLHNCYGIGKRQISAPNLFHLKIFVCRQFGVYVENMSSPVNASLYSSKSLDSGKVPATDPKLLYGLLNATSLRLAMCCPPVSILSPK
jgi:hypothetical protein